MTCVRQLHCPPERPPSLAQNAEISVSSFQLLIHTFLISSFPTVPHDQSPLSPPSGVAGLPAHPTNLFAVCGYEVEAAGGDGQSDWHSSKFQITPAQDGAEWAATGLGKGPRVSEAGVSQHRETPTLLPLGFLPTCPTCAFPLHLHITQQQP